MRLSLSVPHTVKILPHWWPNLAAPCSISDTCVFHNTKNMKSFRFFLPRSNILNGSNQGFTRFDLSDEDVANSYTSLRPGAPNSAQPTTQLEMESGRMVNNGELCRSSDDEGPPEPVKFPTQQDVPNPDQITEWQAGWNVTNAIQVSEELKLLLLFSLHARFLEPRECVFTAQLQLMFRIKKKTM